MLAEDLDGSTRVRLQRPVPYSTALTAQFEGGTRQLIHKDSPVAVASPTAEAISAPPFVEAEAVLDYPKRDMAEEFYADCFVCGRPSPDGLGIGLRRVGERCSAAVWTPSACDAIQSRTVPNRFLWGALDCPGGYASLAPTMTLGVLGSLAVDVRFQPDSNTNLVVVGEGSYVDGRKFGANTAIYTAEREIVTGSAIWIALAEAA